MRVHKALYKRSLNSPGEISPDSALKSERFAPRSGRFAVSRGHSQGAHCGGTHNARFHSNTQRQPFMANPQSDLKTHVQLCQS